MPFGRMRNRRGKPGLLTVNHCRITPFGTVAGTENQQAVFTGAEPSTNRGSHIPVGAILKKIVIRLYATDATPVNGKHSCFMVYQPGATTYATPIGSYLSTVDPLTEEAIQVRQNKLSEWREYVTITGATGPPRHTCIWRGTKTIRDGDDVNVTVLDDAATAWEGSCYAWYIT